MKQTMKWLFVEEQGNSVVFRCSVCNSEITVKYGEELPYCKHCESEPDGEQIAKKMTDNEIIKAMKGCACTPDCEWCPYYDPKKEHEEKCYIRRNRDFNNLMKHKDEQIEGLVSGQETLQKYIAEKDAEIERLNAYISRCESGEEYWVKCLLERPAEAVKEFAERFLKKIHENHYMLSDKHNSTDKGMFTIGIEQSVKETEKEMVGDTE